MPKEHLIGPKESMEDTIRGKMGKGDTLVLRNGDYDQPIGGTFQSKPWANWSIPGGSPDQYTVVKAETDGEVRLNKKYIYLGGGVADRTAKGTDFVQFEGMDLIQNSVNVRHCHHVKFLRVGIKNGKAITSRYGTCMSINEGSHHVLWEDGIVVGSMRYGVNVYESHSVILRRLIGRFDANAEREPKAEFNFYGGTPRIKPTYDCLAQNLLVLDTNRGGGNGSVSTSMRTVHAGRNIRFQGCFGGNLPKNAFGLTEEYPAGNNQLTHSGVARIGGYGVILREGDPDKEIFINEFSVIQALDFLAQWSGSTDRKAVVKIINSGFMKVLNGNYDFKGSGQGPSHRIPTLRFGKSGTLWGEPGFDAIDEGAMLWPWPMQERWAKLARRPDGIIYPTKDWRDKPYEVKNDTERGFADPETTVTDYVHQLAGLEGPDPAPPPPPAAPPTVPPVEDPPESSDPEPEPETQPEPIDPQEGEDQPKKHPYANNLEYIELPRGWLIIVVNYEGDPVSSAYAPDPKKKMRDQLKAEGKI